MLQLALIVAGGSGRRMGGAVPKQFLELAGKPVLLHTLAAFLQYQNPMGPFAKIFVALPPDHIRPWQQNLRHAFIGELADRAAQTLQLVSGGASRTLSVWNGLQAAEHFAAQNEDKEPTLIAIHDGVRPFVTNQMLDDSLRAARIHGAAVCCVPVKSTMRRRVGRGSETVDRTQYYHVQTPQTFRLDWLTAAYRAQGLQPGAVFTDDAAVAEAAGHAVHLVEGAYDNLKITTPDDLWVAERILAERHKGTLGGTTDPLAC